MTKPDERSGSRPDDRRRLRWLIDPETRGPLLPLTGAWVLALDWLLFSSNVLSAGTATPVLMLAGFALGGAGAFLLQWRLARVPAWKALLEAVLVGIVVGLPWPVGGTLLGGWVLLLSGLKR